LVVFRRIVTLDRFIHYCIYMVFFVGEGEKNFFNEDSLRAIVGLLEPTGIRLAFYLILFFYGSRHAFGSLALSIILRFIY